MKISTIRKKALKTLRESRDLSELSKIHKDLLGKKGEINLLLKGLSSIPIEKRKKVGKSLNLLKVELQDAYLTRSQQFKENSSLDKLTSESIDITLPGGQVTLGTLHPVSSAIRDISKFFTNLGFEVVLGPEIETDYYNFEALNIPEDHPAKDMHDTFYLENGRLLRTHTSPVQIRTMQKKGPPIRMICPGRVFRKDSDLTHTPMYHNIEGLVVEEGASFATLKGLIKDFLIDFFGEKVELRFRPSYFPFTEPSAEVDIKWKKGWLEIMGCGMVHPNVLKNCGIDEQKNHGFAFGLGPERIAMLKYGIKDLRYFFENDLRFLKQF